MTTTHAPCLPLLDLPGEPPHERGLGCLAATVAAQRVTLPLARVEVTARVAERVASVTVDETFRNTLTEPIEATYIFPLPGGAAVSDFELRVAGRIVKGKVEERGQARANYKKAVKEGKRAALLEQERDDVFTVQAGNIPPGEDVTVRLTYSERLPFHEDGTTEIRLPLVVAPRYVPGSPLERPPVGDGVEADTDVVPDASRISPPRLAPGFDPEVSLKVEVEILRDGGADLADLACSQHAIRASGAAGATRITLARRDDLLDRDFVLRWRLAGEGLRTTLLTHTAPDGQVYGMLSIVPPKRDGFLGLPRDVVFVLDRSGSMEGVKMTSAARACATLLQTLAPRDRYTILAFDDHVEAMTEDFIAASEANIDRGERHLRTIDSRGGTEIDLAMERALALIRGRKDAADTVRAPVIVLLTDGQVGDESRILKRIQKEIGDARLFAVGIDTAVNEGLLKRLAVLGGGTAAFVEPGAAIEDALRSIGREIGAPLVVDVAVEDLDAGLDPASLAPAVVPDLFAGRAATAFFRMTKPGRVRLRGRSLDHWSLQESVEAKPLELPAIAQLWAKARVTDLEDQFRLADGGKQKKLKAEIIAISIAHSLLTRFTAFVAVDHAEVVNAKGDPRKVVQPVHQPAQWEMEAKKDSAAMPQKQKMSAPCKKRSAPPSMARCAGAMPPEMDDLLEGKMADEECAQSAPPPGAAMHFGSSAGMGSSGAGKNAGAGGGGIVGKIGALFARAAGIPAPAPAQPPAPAAPPAPCAPAASVPAAPGGTVPPPSAFGPPLEPKGGFGKMAGGAQLTAAGMTLGTVVYMSPEQLMGRDLTSAADVYAAGVVLFEACTGKLPFYHENEMQLMKMIMKDLPPRPSALNASIPPGLDAAILGALEKDPKKRYPTAAALATALRAAIPVPPRPAPATSISVRAVGPTRGAVAKQIGGYSIAGTLGEGGMGVVYLATDATGQPVAVKQLHPNLVGAESIRNRFVRGARAACKLKHPNIAATLDVIEDATGIYIVSELVDGRTLETCIEAGPLPPAEAVAILLEVLAALQYVHEQGALHRDLKPSEDIMILQGGAVKVFSFAGTDEGPPAAPKADPGRAAIAGAVRALEGSLRTAEEEVHAGRTPAAPSIEQSRRRLLDALRDDAGLACPQLQRLVRLGLAEVVAALRGPSTLAMVEVLLKRARKALDEARPELAAAATGRAPVGAAAAANGGAEEEFWEASV